MLTHDEIVKAVTRASLNAGFAILRHEHDSSPMQYSLRIVPEDRQHLEPPRGATMALSYPDVLMTAIEIQSFPSEEDSQFCAQVELMAAYHIPYPAYLGLDQAVMAARGLRIYLIDTLTQNPPPEWEHPEGDEEGLAAIFDAMFSTTCTAFEGGSEQHGVDIRLDQLWVFAQAQPTNEAEIEGESEAMLAVIEYVWGILVPDEYRDDPLAPLSFLFPEG